MDGKKSGNLIRISNKLVYNHPSHIQVQFASAFAKSGDSNLGTNLCE